MNEGESFRKELNDTSISKNTILEQRRITICGVPQGSVLRPLLFCCT